MSKQHKKRGRKPKSNIIVNNNPIFKNETLNDIIVCINNVSGCDNSYLDDNGDNICDDNIITSNNILECKNCNFVLSNNKIDLPIKYIDNVFISTNSFCSFECAHRHCYDNMNNYNESLSLLHLYYYKTFNKYSIIKLPKPNSVLKQNGGYMSIDKYRESFKNNKCALLKLSVVVPILCSTPTFCA